MDERIALLEKRVEELEQTNVYILQQLISDREAGIELARHLLEIENAVFVEKNP